VGSVRFCDRLSRQVQPPDAENRMSGGVAEVTGAIPSPRADLQSPSMSSNQTDNHEEHREHEVFYFDFSS
jgi:hypothetical protein